MTFLPFLITVRRGNMLCYPHLPSLTYCIFLWKCTSVLFTLFLCYLRNEAASSYTPHMWVLWSLWLKILLKCKTRKQASLELSQQYVKSRGQLRRRVLCMWRRNYSFGFFPLCYLRTQKHMQKHWGGLLRGSERMKVCYTSAKSNAGWPSWSNLKRKQKNPWHTQ